MSRNKKECNYDCENCRDMCDAMIEYYEERRKYPPEEMITEKDIWYAMTDGMYGDYPGGDIDYDKLGFD